MLKLENIIRILRGFFKNFLKLKHLLLQLRKAVKMFVFVNTAYKSYLYIYVIKYSDNDN